MRITVSQSLGTTTLAFSKLGDKRTLNIEEGNISVVKKLKEDETVRIDMDDNGEDEVEVNIENEPVNSPRVMEDAEPVEEEEVNRVAESPVRVEPVARVESPVRVESSSTAPKPLTIESPDPPVKVLDLDRVLILPKEMVDSYLRYKDTSLNKYIKMRQDMGWKLITVSIYRENHQVLNKGDFYDLTPMKRTNVTKLSPKFYHFWSYAVVTKVKRHAEATGVTLDGMIWNKYLEYVLMPIFVREVQK